MVWETPGKASPKTEAVEPTVPAESQDQSEAILTWLQAAHSAAYYKQAEMEARRALIGAYFDGKEEKGTRRFHFANGYSLKYGQTEKLEFVKLDYLSDTDLESQIQALESFIRAMGAEASFIADRLIKWAPSLSKTEYDKLDMRNPLHVNIKTAVDNHLITKYNAPTMELEPPKEPKT